MSLSSNLSIYYDQFLCTGDEQWKQKGDLKTDTLALEMGTVEDTARTTQYICLRGEQLMECVCSGHL